MAAWNVIAFINALTNATPVSAASPLPVGQYVGGAAVSAASPLPTSEKAVVGGGVTWGAYTPITLSGSSQTLVAANAARKAIRIINTGNAVAAYNLAGGAAVLTAGDVLAAGAKDWFINAPCPVGAITVIGTAGQTVTFTEGT